MILHNLKALHLTTFIMSIRWNLTNGNINIHKKILNIHFSPTH